jgi:DNA-binding CsgD family transcriptional regulator
VPLELGFLAHFATPKGTMPLDAATFLLKMLPLLAAARHADLAEASRMAEWLAIRLSSPRLQFLGHSWRALANALDGNAAAAEREARGLLTEARRVRPALRVVPQLLEAIATKQVEAFVAAESFARRSGHVWAQASALLWLAALAPTPAVATRARRLFTATGWRRPPGVADIGAQAVAGLLGEGARGTWVLELARAIAPLSAAVPVAVVHVRDRALPIETRMLALEILKQAGATSAREELRPVAREQGPLGHAAAEWLASPGRPLGLSERELQVLELAGDGLTDKAIADRLGLSWHTVARHLANARSKLGATNRSAAAVALEQLRHKGATR